MEWKANQKAETVTQILFWSQFSSLNLNWTEQRKQKFPDQLFYVGEWEWLWQFVKAIGLFQKNFSYTASTSGFKVQAGHPKLPVSGSL